MEERWPLTCFSRHPCLIMTPLNSSFRIMSSSLEFSSQKNPLSGYEERNGKFILWVLGILLFYHLHLPLPSSHQGRLLLFLPRGSYPNLNLKGCPWLARFPSPFILFLDARPLLFLLMWSCQYPFIFLGSPRYILSLGEHISFFRAFLLLGLQGHILESRVS